MIELSYDSYYKVSIQILKKLIFENFEIGVNFDGHHELMYQTKFCYETSTFYFEKPTEKNLLIEEIKIFLTNEDYKYEKIESVLWILSWKNIIPHGKYLVSNQMINNILIVCHL